MTTPLASHGTLVAYQQAPGGVPAATFTTLAEQGDITFPFMSRNVFDATTQTRQIDSKILGVIRRAPMMIKVNYIPNDSTHDAITGIHYIFKNNYSTGWQLTIPILPAPTTSVWVGTGQIKDFANLVAPVDGKLALDMSVEWSGIMTIDGVQFG
jgi:hypothetical protein